MLNKVLILLPLLFATILGAPDYLRAAETCSSSICSLPDCRCASTSPPDNIEKSETPQFVMLTFDDAVQLANYDIYTDLFYDKTNPDGCPISATFFTAHEYTDYTKVHDLHVHNHEIALHSITHQALTDYWKNLSIDALTQEFGGEKTIISKFANIPEDAIKGMRLPFLQLSGDNSFKVAKDIGLLYDCSWPTQTYRNPGLWPYTLDYKSDQDCPIGPCPSSSIPGVWVVPMLDWTDQSNIVCSMVDACVNIPDNDADDLTQWFIDNFNVQYKGNKAPFGFYVHAAYFNVNSVRLEAYKKFVAYLLSLDDVFLVSPGRVIQWMQNPVPIGSANWPNFCPAIEDLGCVSKTCALLKEGNPNPEYMTICGSECPAVYPWLGNPLGEEISSS